MEFGAYLDEQIKSWAVNLIKLWCGLNIKKQKAKSSIKI